jgi:hypothetical protein
MMMTVKPPCSTPRTPGGKKMKRHSLKPHIFLQLELSAPRGRAVDPSTIPVLDRNNSNEEDFSQMFTTHIRVEHCNSGLLPETSIREEDYPMPHEEENESSFRNEEWPETSIPAPPEDDAQDRREMSPSPPVSVMKVLGRHDHLLEPFPPTPTQEEMVDNETTAPRTAIDMAGRLVDVSKSLEDLFGLVLDEEQVASTKAPRGFRRCQSLGMLDYEPSPKLSNSDRHKSLIEMSPLPVSVMKVLGRHDHLLEPFPSTPIQEELVDIETTAPRTAIDMTGRPVDVSKISKSSLENLFGSVLDEERVASTKSPRKKSAGRRSNVGVEPSDGIDPSSRRSSRGLSSQRLRSYNHEKPQGSRRKSLVERSSMRDSSRRESKSEEFAVPTAPTTTSKPKSRRKSDPDAFTYCKPQIRQGFSVLSSDRKQVPHRSVEKSIEEVMSLLVAGGPLKSPRSQRRRRSSRLVDQQEISFRAKIEEVVVAAS